MNLTENTMGITQKELQKRIEDSYEIPNNVLITVEKPLVTVRTSTYQHGAYIKECIEGVLNQKTKFNFEYIIGEDYSTDGTREIVFEYAKKYPDIIRVITADYNVGSKANGRRCILAARGKYMATLEGDDYWIDPLKLQKQVDFLEKNEDYGLVFTDADHLIEETGQIIHSYDKTHKRKIPSGNVINTLLYSNPYKTCTSLYKTEDILDFSEKTVNVKDNIMGDIELWLYIANKSKVAYLPVSTTVYRVQKKSASHFLQIEKAESFAKNRVDISLKFAKENNLPIDMKKLKRNYTNTMIKFCIVNNKYKYLTRYLHEPLSIIKILLKEKIVRPLMIGIF